MLLELATQIVGLMSVILSSKFVTAFELVIDLCQSFIQEFDL